MSDRLSERLAARIRARGPITFAEYMETALYDPDEGFFSRAPVGRDFVTSPHVSPLFGALLARQVREVSEILREPAMVVDAGAGDGALGRQLFEVDLDMRYVAVERSPAARAHLTSLGLATRERLPESIVGCVIANELLDNLPFHRLRNVGGRMVEVMVGLDGDRFVEVEAEPTIEPRAPIPGGDERPVSPARDGFVRDLARALKRGYAFLIDYGFTAGEDPEPIRTYAEHRMGFDVLVDPGARDITGPVDFDALADEARADGLDVHGPVTQRDALHNLGYRELLDRMRRQQREQEAAGDHRSAVETFGARGDASMLVDPAGLGAHKVLVLATPGLPPPRAVRYGPSLA